jgi:hypothetical protein
MTVQKRRWVGDPGRPAAVWPVSDRDSRLLASRRPSEFLPDFAQKPRQWGDTKAENVLFVAV